MLLFFSQRVVKMSSPNLNNIIILGSILIYIWVAVSGIDNTLVSDAWFYVMCQVCLLKIKLRVFVSFFFFHCV